MNEFEIIEFESLASTNDSAKNFFEQGKCDFVVVTEEQTAGRGAYQTKWLSEKGKNLTFSIGLCYNLLAKDQFLISQITALSLFDYLKNKGIDAKIKWPNDILAEGKKISGVLIESTIKNNFVKNFIIGIGFNLNQEVFKKGLYATSLKNLTKKTYDKKVELTEILNIFVVYVLKLKEKKFKVIREKYFDNLVGTEKPVRYKAGDKEFEAIVSGLDEYGRLILDINGNKKVFGFKEIEMLKPTNYV